jgi:integrase
MSKRLLQDVKAVFEYGAVHGLCEGDPTFGVGKALAAHKEQHHQSLQPDAIPPFLAAWRGYRAKVYPTTARALEFMLLTFQRTGERIGATWGEIDWDKAEWRIPEARMKEKGRGEHVVPLSTQALEILKAQWADTMGGECTRALDPANPANPLNPDAAGAYIWPSKRPGKHMSNQTLLQVLRRMGWADRLAPHGLRGTATTALADRLRFDGSLIDLQLAHKEKNKVTAAYNHAKRLEERAEMMQAWGDWVEKIQG